MTWGQFFNLVVRYRVACLAWVERPNDRQRRTRDELGRAIDAMIADRLHWLELHEQQGTKFPELLTTATWGGFRDIVVIHRFHWAKYEREPTSNQLQARDDSGWSIDELIRERQRRASLARPVMAPTLFEQADASQGAA